MSNETWNPGKTSTPAKDLSQPDLACSSQSVDSPTLNEHKPVQEVSVEEKDLEKDGNCSYKEAAAENTDDGNIKIDTNNNDKKKQKEQVPVISFYDREFIESLKETCAEAVKKTFAEIKKERELISSQSPEKELDDNVDNIEEAKLWAVRQKQSCTNKENIVFKD